MHSISWQSFKQAIDTVPNVTIDLESFHGDGDGDMCRRFLARHRNVPCTESSVLYALPIHLADTIARANLPLTRTEADFERNLAHFCHDHKAVGIVDDSFVRCPLLADEPMPTISPKQFDDLGWGDSMSFERVRTSIEIGADRLEPLKEHARAYCGWLLTDTQFKDERKTLRERRDQQSMWRSFAMRPDGETDNRLALFLDRWLLADLNSWDLPLPQGPNLSTVNWHSGSLSNQVAITVPVTVPLQARYPIHEIVEEVRHNQMPPHLLEWNNVIKGAPGTLSLVSFSHIFRLHFYRDLVLMQRYGDHFKGQLQRLDCVFAEFLGLKDRQIRSLRSAIADRAAGVTA